MQQVPKGRTTLSEPSPPRPSEGVHPSGGALSSRQPAPARDTIAAASAGLACSQPADLAAPSAVPTTISVRSAFVAPPDTLLVSADYSQLEMRLSA